MFFFANTPKNSLAINNHTNQFKEGSKGHPFRIGRELYSTLSNNIHHYKADQGNGCDVRSDQWGESVRKILTVLRPMKFNNLGEVEWVLERERYM